MVPSYRAFSISGQLTESIAESSWPNWVGSSPLYLSVSPDFTWAWKQSQFPKHYVRLYFRSTRRWTKSSREVILNVCTVNARFSGLMPWGRGRVGGVVGCSGSASWHTHTYIYVYILVCVCVCVYIYIYIYIWPKLEMRTSEAEQPDLGDVLPRHCTHSYNFDIGSENKK